MKLKTSKYLVAVLFSFFIMTANSQNKSVTLKGFVKYDTYNIPNINILNKTTELGSSSNENGRFTIKVTKGDSLIFSSLVYKNRIIKITDTHLKSKSITVYLESDINQLEEIMLEKNIIINWQNAAVTKGTILNNDKTSNSKPPNARLLTDPNARGGGINFISIFQQLTQKWRLKRKTKKRKFKKIQVLKNEFSTTTRNKYGDTFFTEWLKIPEMKINLFLDYCEGNGLRELYDNDEIIIKNFLIKQSKKFNSINN